jgi:HSP20 family molecular chaperone IbpA
LTDSGFGVATIETYPSFAIEQLSDDVFLLSVIMPPVADDQLTISLEKQELIVSAVSKEDPSVLNCEHRFALSVPCTFAGANWERETLLIELVCHSASVRKSPNELVTSHRAHGKFFEESADKAA